MRQHEKGILTYEILPDLVGVVILVTGEGPAGAGESIDAVNKYK